MARKAITHDTEHGGTGDYWDAFDAFTASLDDEWPALDLAAIPVTEDELANWDDIAGIDIDGMSGVHTDASGNEVQSVAWLHSLLYSDYADPSDDDDRADMDIPVSVLAAMHGEDDYS